MLVECSHNVDITGLNDDHLQFSYSFSHGFFARISSCSELLYLNNASTLLTDCIWLSFSKAVCAALLSAIFFVLFSSSTSASAQQLEENSVVCLGRLGYQLDNTSRLAEFCLGLYDRFCFFFVLCFYSLYHILTNFSQQMMIRRVPTPVPWRGHVIAAKAMGAFMWCWIFWRLKHDYKDITVS